MDPILKSHFSNFKNAFEIDTTSELLEAQKRSEEEKRKGADAFERFVNYIIFSLDDPDVFTANPDLLDSVSVGGALDTGIDGLGIVLNGRLVQSTDMVDQIVESSKKLQVDFVFVQSKNRTGIDIGEFQKFGLGIRNFFSEGYLPTHQGLYDLRQVKDYILADENIVKRFENNPSLTAYYVSVGDEANDSNFDGSRNMLIDDLKKLYFESITISAIGGSRLVKLCRELHKQFEKTITIKDIFPLTVGNEEKVSKAHAFTCSAPEFIKLLEKDDGQLRRSLFNDNVRDYLGNKGAVNTEIEATISDSPEMFLLRNNGVAIVCSDFVQVRDKLVTLKNPQIVNGCQTSNSLFNFRHHKNIDNVQILVRVIATEDLEISNSIVRGTNKQNQVLDEAFEATLPFHQEKLEPFFLAVRQENAKLYYERRSKQYSDDPIIKRTQIVNLRILTQSYVAIILGRPHESFRHEAKLLEMYGGADSDRKIFCGDHDPYPYYICALTWNVFDRAFRDYSIDRKYSAYRQHLCFLFARLVAPVPRSVMPSKVTTKWCGDMQDALQSDRFPSLSVDVVSLFDQAMDEWLRRGRSKFGIKDNREFTETLLRQFTPSPLVPDLSEPLPVVREVGSILRVIWREEGHWFAFIRRGNYEENVYFDNRAYTGELTQLVPGAMVEYSRDSPTRASRVAILQ